MPGEGDFPVVDFMRAVAATGYSGTLSLEIFNDRFRAGSARTIAADGHRSLIYLMDQVRRTEPAPLAISLPSMPDRSEIEGIEFIEFTTDFANATSLSNLFTQLGFVETGRHKSKQVARYQQGEINLVINTEREGLARSSFIAHGTSVYAFGIRVADAHATVSRAKALGAEVFSQTVSVGELEFQRVRGVGGGLIYFLDRRTDLGRVWDIEFVSTRCERRFRLRLTANRPPSTNYELRSDADVAPLLSFDLRCAEKSHGRRPGPAGLIRSQAIESLSGTFRLTLNGAENSRTLAGKFLSETFGSSIQHLAFGSSDIFATACLMSGRGFEDAGVLKELLRRLGGSIWPRTCIRWQNCAKTTSSMIVMKAVSSFSFTVSPLERGSFSKWCSGWGTEATEPPTRPSALRPKSAPCNRLRSFHCNGVYPFKGIDHALSLDRRGGRTAARSSQLARGGPPNLG